MRAAALPRLQDLNPLKFLPLSKVSYARLPGYDSSNASPFSIQPLNKYRWRSPSPGSDRFSFLRWSPFRLAVLTITIALCVALLGGGITHHIVKKNKQPPPRELFTWEHFDRLDSYYHGVRTLVPPSEYRPENPLRNTTELPASVTPRSVDESLPKEPPLDPVRYTPYPHFESTEYLHDHAPVQPCYLDEEKRTPAPDTYAYPGLPSNMSQPYFGSYGELGLADDVCFDRYGRFGPYGYGYNMSEGGLGLGNISESEGSEKVFAAAGKVDYRSMDWGTAQKKCYEKNRARFENVTRDSSGNTTNSKKKVQRHAYVLRTWTGFFYNDHQLLSLRALINELSLKSGGEYDVHFLVHVKDDSIPIWASDEMYNKTLRDNVPREFWNISTLWSEGQMVNYYPQPFPDNVANMAGSGIHGVYRSAHFPLQWFAQQHPEYDFFWNWEMDLRYTGHYYEFHSQVGRWAAQQPRKGLWERGARFYIPGFHGSWADFTARVEAETRESGGQPIWGPVNDFPHTGMLPSPNSTAPPHSYDDDKYEWGVGEDADLIVFNPLFDPSATNWVFRDDVTGYNTTLPEPPRRAAIITVARLSRRLLATMHEETWRMRHTMFPEMWPPTVCLHHGYKAVYVPHPVFFDRDWPLGYMDRVFNHPKEAWESPFGWGEHNLLGSSFYYNSGFSGALWRRWLGQQENGEGGRAQEEGWARTSRSGAGTGRMCLRGTLLHPIKHEMNSPE
ncbi:hypothetical protein BJ546DRAFT_856979 [Cryomyces antarcticus]